MKANKKTISLLGIALAFTLGTVGLYFFFFSAMKSKSEATMPLIDRIDELTGKQARIDASLATLAKQATSSEKLATYFFKTDEIVLFTQKIEQLGPLSGTTLSIQSLEQTPSDKTPSMSFRLNVTGRFENIQRLFLLIENFPGKIEWKTTSLNRTSGLTGAPEWTAAISLSAHNFIN